MKSPIHISVKSEIIPISLVIIAVALGGYFYYRFPERIASHWNFQGHIDGYSSKTGGAFGIPLLLAGMYLMFLILPFIDPKKDRYAEFATVYLTFRTMMMAVLLVLYVCMGLFNLGYPVQVGIVSPILIGMMMVILGNFLGKVKPNWWMGIRTPWTLSSDTVWNKTHRVGGYAFIIFGILIMISPWLGPSLGMAAFIAGILIVSVGTMMYSFFLYQREESDKNTKNK
jgi:uncharacterized membrane protein